MNMDKIESILMLMERAIRSSHPLRYVEDLFDVEQVIESRECQEEIMFHLALLIANDEEQRASQWLDDNTQARMLDVLLDKNHEPRNKWELFKLFLYEGIPVQSCFYMLSRMDLIKGLMDMYEACQDSSFNTSLSVEEPIPGWFAEAIKEYEKPQQSSWLDGLSQVLRGWKQRLTQQEEQLYELLDDFKRAMTQPTLITKGAILEPALIEKSPSKRGFDREEIVFLGGFVGPGEAPTLLTKHLTTKEDSYLETGIVYCTVSSNQSCGLMSYMSKSGHCIVLELDDKDDTAMPKLWYPNKNDELKAHPKGIVKLCSHKPSKVGTWRFLLLWSPLSLRELLGGQWPVAATGREWSSATIDELGKRIIEIVGQLQGCMIHLEVKPHF